MRAEHSRGLRLAGTATGELETVLEQRLRDAAVSVSVDPTVPGTLEVAACLLETLRRGPGRLSVDPAGLTDGQVREIVCNANVVAEHASIDMAGSHALLTDPETYARENVGTYSLGTITDADGDVAKVDLAAAAMPGWVIEKLKGTVKDSIAKIDAHELRWPPVVLAGVDSIEARHDAQGLWPDRLIDAATGDTAVGLHDIAPGGPCLRCLMPAPAARGSAAQVLADELGLPIELVMRGATDLDGQHLAGLAPDQRERLAPFVGKPICGLADALGLTGNEGDDYRPSVPFVSQQAACLGVGRLIATLTGVEDLPNVVQYNTLIGPQSMTRLHRRPTPGCYCQHRAPTISVVRDSRRASSTHESNQPAAD